MTTFLEDTARGKAVVLQARPHRMHNNIEHKVKLWKSVTSDTHIGNVGATKLVHYSVRTLFAADVGTLVRKTLYVLSFGYGDCGYLKPSAADNSGIILKTANV
jgi:hypothetical protein